MLEGSSGDQFLNSKQRAPSWSADCKNCIDDVAAPLERGLENEERVPDRGRVSGVDCFYERPEGFAANWLGDFEREFCRWICENHRGPPRDAAEPAPVELVALPVVRDGDHVRVIGLLSI